MLNEAITNIKGLSLEGVVKLIDQGDIIRLIEEAMREKNFNKARLAKALNKSRGWASQLMKNKINISVQTLLEIAKVLKISPSSLLPGSNPKSSELSLEEYIRQICKDEITKIFKSDTAQGIGKPDRSENGA
jgi:transcriptional regulator with XRE-family HTH domain